MHIRVRMLVGGFQTRFIMFNPYWLQTSLNYFVLRFFSKQENQQKKWKTLSFRFLFNFFLEQVHHFRCWEFGVGEDRNPSLMWLSACWKFHTFPSKKRLRGVVNHVFVSIVFMESWNVVTNLIMYYIALLLSCFSSFQFLNRQGFFQDESLSRIQLWRIPEVNRTWVNHPNWKKENHLNQTFMLGFHVRFPRGVYNPKKRWTTIYFRYLTFLMNQWKE